MNKHFGDAWYYLRRAAEHLSIGLREELEPVERAARERFGWEEKSEQTRLDRFRSEIRRVERVEPVRKARTRIDDYRRPAE